jgi:hypothetical protein
MHDLNYNAQTEGWFLFSRIVREKINNGRSGGDPLRSQLSCDDADPSYYRNADASRDRRSDASL